MRYGVTLLLLSVSASDAIAQDRAGPVPTTMHFERFYSGDVTTIGYFTRAQVVDPVWEAWRARHVLRGKPPRRIVRRELRWFAWLGSSRPDCARIVYVTQMIGPDGQSAAETNTNELIRLTALAREPMNPIPIGCEYIVPADDPKGR